MTLGAFKTSQDCDEFIKKRDLEIAYFKKKYPSLTNLPNGLRNMAEKVDEYNQKKYKKELKSRLEEWYLTIYWLLSNSVHLTSRGLNSFFIVNPDKSITANLSGDINDLERITATTYIFYSHTLKVFCDLFKVGSKKEINGFNKELQRILFGK